MSSDTTLLKGHTRTNAKDMAMYRAAGIEVPRPRLRIWVKVFARWIYDNVKVSKKIWQMYKKLTRR